MTASSPPAPCRLILALLLAFLPGWGATVAMAAEEEASEAAEPSVVVRTVRFESSARLQTEVWLDGERLGRTPFRAELAVGEYFLTATADAVIPLTQPFAVGPDGDQYAILPARPVTTENYLPVSRDLFRALVHYPDNPHLLIAALYLTIDAEEAGRLLARADEAVGEDATLEALRARYHLRGGRIDEALEAVSRALEMEGTLALAWRVRADILAEQGDHRQALAAANYAVIQEPYGWRNLRTRARIHSALGYERAAAQDTERADELYEAMHTMGRRPQ